MLQLKSLVFLGTREIGAGCLQHLLEQRSKLGFEVSGVLTDDERVSDLVPTVGQLAERAGIRRIGGLEQYAALDDDIDIAISVQYHEILGPPALRKAREITVNYHMAPLPEYRGCNQFSFAIVHADQEFGTTLHRMSEAVDAGEIIAERRFEIPAGCFVDELYRMTCEQTLRLFRDTLPRLVDGHYELVPQEKLIQAGRQCSRHLRREIDDLKRIELDWEAERIERHVRATCMPGFPPPYCMIGGRRFDLICRPEENRG